MGIQAGGTSLIIKDELPLAAVTLGSGVKEYGFAHRKSRRHNRDWRFDQSSNRRLFDLKR
jgi:hypothetical protein